MRLFVFGLGYTAMAFIRSGLPWTRVAGTVRDAGKAGRLREEGIEALALEEAGDAELAGAIGRADALLVCAPPSEAGDPLLVRFGEAVRRAAGLGWIGYLSTTGVYGDRDGAWTDETTPANPQSPASRHRHDAETAWVALGRETGQAVQVFRLTGIYGPGRNALANLAQGTARRIVKPGQVFNRIHVDDIALTLAASLARPRAGGVYNVTDDEPAPPQDVVTYAAALAGIAPPPEIPFERAHLSPAALAFYAENKRIANGLIKRELGVELRHPTYREGLDALYAAGEFQVA
ncbi:SDR family oxidoreductase [Microvirga thermotolerans]|uniref:NAD-dependent epimerase/dehydratase family protein n=1 Tax=Microvirga thermotolerans TaxID=2651334 RepID=A0A5P9K1R6_9HYPH|nr:SDR family oxidoreductase [Microvirga thermotolerans]QFU17555.1 NAD-dependent epimerase/dehydratase family protein [Microvirga thermotolerans]